MKRRENSRKIMTNFPKDLSVGRHLILDAWQIPVELLNDAEQIRLAMETAVEACEGTLIDFCLHSFSPHGVTAAAILAESHLAIHTWPEHGYLGADLFYCGRGNPRASMDSLVQSFQAGGHRVRELSRGLGDASDPSGWMQHSEPADPSVPSG